MKSGWFVRVDYPEGKKMYQVYRLLDANEPDLTNNREEYAEYSSRDGALKIAKKLNADEAAHFWK